MKRLVLLISVACSTRSVPDAGVALPSPAIAVEPPLTAGHGAAIELVAITDDGSAAVTQDAIGGTRLWPTLDGTREPIVLRVPMATQLSIGRAGDSFVIASLDEGGGAEVVHVASSGRVIERTSIAPEPPIRSIVVASQGVIAARADQTLAILTPSGEAIARLEAPAASRISFVIARGAHTLVLFAHDNTTNGRWLDGTGWGGVTPDFQLDPISFAALSPSGTRLLIDFETAPYVIDLETGKIVDSYRAGMPLGFCDDDTLLQLKAGRVVWQQLGDKYGGVVEEIEPAVEPIAVANGIAVSPQGSSLALHARDKIVQLGYRVSDIAGMHVTAGGVLVTAPDRHALMLDRSLAALRSLELPADTRVLADLQPIDDRFAIETDTYKGMSWWSLSVVDLHRATTWQAPQSALVRGDIRYEPASRLLEITDPQASYLLPWNPKLHSFDTWYRLEGGPQDVHLLAPAANDGLVAIATRPEGHKLEINEFHGDDLKIGSAIRPRRHYFVEGFAVGVDRIGHVYVIDHGDLVIYSHGSETSRIHDVGDLRVSAQPSGSYIALFGDSRIRMYDVKGTPLWAIAAPLAQQITWLDDELLVDYAGGLGKIDAATGALNKKVCGWSFGLSALSRNDVLAGDSICDAQ
ncbi:MAG TPA: hypothetical protein VIV40_32800 [Kofleriaceae bacterium]